MMRLFRLAVLLFVAFVAGIFYERSSRREECAIVGGDWRASGLCTYEVSDG